MPDSWFVPILCTILIFAVIGVAALESLSVKAKKPSIRRKK